ncbi:MAG TPA: hypothetical protein VLW85_26125 [Myxococcales bacterium]|nr:hypothetical protein [Myxococcales bacterium]
MFWKLVILALVSWSVAMYFSVTLGGLVHLLPASAIVCVVVRRMAKTPDTAFGQWRMPSDRGGRRQ